MKKIPGFRDVPFTGVIYVMQQAYEHGYHPDSLEWANLGQGSPEVGPLAGAPARVDNISISMEQNEYSPINGQRVLREKIADFYNQLFRQGKPSQYTFENVSISGGGRIALTRVIAALGNINMGHFLPDYTAYEELLSIFKAFIPIPILINPNEESEQLLDQIKKEIYGRGLQAILLSNPCNPTGKVINTDQLRQLVTMAREYSCSMIVDEFYSHFIYSNFSGGATPNIISITREVDDVNQDPIIIIDGVTKNWRYPGWRISWAVGPKEVIKAIASVGSFLDGGANNPFQKEVVNLLDLENTILETAALQKCFLSKRDYVLNRLYAMNISVESKPNGTFYIWANLSDLPPPLNDGFKFFEAGLKEKVITVPGVFFDVNPEKRRHFARFGQYIRISFGAEQAVLERGLNAIQRLITKYNS